KRHLALDQHGLLAAEQRPARFDLLLEHLDVDAAHLVLELEEGDATGPEDALAEVFDHAREAYLGPLLHPRKLDRRGQLEAPQLLAVAGERMARQVEAERLLLADERLAHVPGIASGIALEPFAGPTAGGGLGLEEGEERRLPALAVLAGASRALEREVDG